MKLIHRFYDLFSGGGEVVVSRIVEAFPEHEHLLVFNNFRATWLSAKLSRQRNVRLEQIASKNLARLFALEAPDLAFFHFYPPMDSADFIDLPPHIRCKCVIYSHWFHGIPNVEHISRYCFPSPFGAKAGAEIPDSLKVTILNPVSDHFFQIARIPGRPFTVGRHSRDDGIKFSEDFAAIYEQIEIEDLQVSVLGCPLALAQALAASLHNAKHNYWLLPMNTMEVHRFLRFIDVCVYKTHDSFAETCPLAILEALAAGIPIVAEDKGGVSDLVIPMKTGYLCRKLPDYKAGVESLYHDPMMLARFSLQAREWAFENASVACYRKRLAQEFGL